MTIITIILATLCTFLFIAVYKLARERERTWSDKDNPARFGVLTQAMTRRVQREGDWEALEHMRYQVRVALRDLNRLRHDPSQQNIRASKPKA